jgi:molybdopterin-containing oxidoreductase family iron-sulfur binding subunit
VSEVQVRKVDDRTARLARAQLEQLEHDRPIVLSRTLAEYARAPDFAADERGTVDSLYEPPGMTAPEQWAMSIDQTICSGCSACLVACQAENNVPTVGKEGVLRRREMYWLRIDHYVDGSHDDPALVSQPMLCQHCEKAPCEYVCPVNATVHSSDGLNEMVYNRCVGTRFCSNNCPYKVRRFNWFDWNERRSELERLVLNPDVTVRERGVMEKCTYCVQRIRRAEIRAGIESREIRVGEVRTACQQACPTGAIEFGSLRHRDGAVSRLHADPRAYEVLHDLGTSPRTRYLARIANPREDVERFASATKERPA